MKLGFYYLGAAISVIPANLDIGDYKTDPVESPPSINITRKPPQSYPHISTPVIVVCLLPPTTNTIYQPPTTNYQQQLPTANYQHQLQTANNFSSVPLPIPPPDLAMSDRFSRLDTLALALCDRIGEVLGMDPQGQYREVERAVPTFVHVMKSAKTLHVDLQDLRASLERERTSLQTAKEEAATELANHQAKYSAALEQCSSNSSQLAAALEKLQISETTSSKQLADVRDELRKCQEAANASKSLYDQAERDRDTELAEKARKVSESETKIEELVSEINRLKEVAQGTSQACRDANALRDELKGARSRVKELEGESSLLRQRVGEFSGQLEAAQVRVRELERRERLLPMGTGTHPNKRPRLSAEGEGDEVEGSGSQQWVSQIERASAWLSAHKPLIEGDAGLTPEEVATEIFPLILADGVGNRIHECLVSSDVNIWFCLHQLASDPYSFNNCVAQIHPNNRCRHHPEGCLQIRRSVEPSSVTCRRG
ncbi:hypothetical protein ABKA04_001190 [Annulohypoxylon sp. FPYF3050]